MQIQLYHFRFQRNKLKKIEHDHGARIARENNINDKKRQYHNSGNLILFCRRLSEKALAHQQ